MSTYNDQNNDQISKKDLPLNEGDLLLKEIAGIINEIIEEEILKHEVIKNIIKKEIQRIKDQYHLSIEDITELTKWVQSDIKKNIKDLSLDDIKKIAEIIKEEINKKIQEII